MLKEVLIFILTLPLVCAQAINVAGKTYSIFFLAPLILIVLGITFLLILYLKDNLPKLIKTLPKNKIKKPKRIKDIPEEKTVDYLKEIRLFEKKEKKLDLEEAFRQLYGLIKEYFYDILEIKQETTLQELEKELAEKKKNLVPLAQKLAHLKYSGAKITRRDLNEVLKDFKDINPRKPRIEIKKPETKLKKLTRILLEKKRFQKKPKFLKKIKLVRAKIKPQKIKEEYKQRKKFFIDLTNIVDFIFKIPKKKELQRTLKKGQKNIKDLEKAKQFYNKSLKIYYALPLEQEKEFADTLFDFYEKIEQEKLNQESEQLQRMTHQIDNIIEKGGIIRKEEKSYMSGIKTTLDLFHKYNQKWTDKIKQRKTSGLKEIKNTLEKIPNKHHALFHIKDSLKKLNKLKKNYEKRKPFEIKIKKEVEIKEHKPKKHEIDILKEIKNNIENIKYFFEVSHLILKHKEINLIHKLKNLIEEIKLKKRKKEYLVHKTELEILDYISSLIQIRIPTHSKIKNKLTHKFRDTMDEIKIKEREGMHTIHNIELGISDRIKSLLEKRQPKMMFPEIEHEIHPHINKLSVHMEKISKHGAYKIQELQPEITKSLKEIIKTARNKRLPLHERLILPEEIVIKKLHKAKFSDYLKQLSQQEQILSHKLANVETQTKKQVRDIVRKMKKVDIPKFERGITPEATKLNKEEIEIFNKISKMDHLEKKLKKQTTLLIQKPDKKITLEYAWLKKAREARYKQTENMKELEQLEKELAKKITSF